MAKFLTEDEVRDSDKYALGFDDTSEQNVRQGTGQLTTFNQLGISGVNDKPDGWYIPDKKTQLLYFLRLRTARWISIRRNVLMNSKKNCEILIQAGYTKVVGILHNGVQTLGFYNNAPIDIPDEIQNKQYYIDLANNTGLDKRLIYDATRRINNNLHTIFGVKNLYHRMIFTACALVAERYGANLNGLKGRDFSMLHRAILSTVNLPKGHTPRSSHTRQRTLPLKCSSALLFTHLS